jgi:hypothetical protein
LPAHGHEGTHSAGEPPPAVTCLRQSTSRPETAVIVAEPKTRDLVLHLLRPLNSELVASWLDHPVDHPDDPGRLAFNPSVLNSSGAVETD